MLNTPLGNILVLIDGKEIDYSATKMDTFELCPNVNGRYKIVFSYTPSMKKLRIACLLDNPLLKGEIESGERLEAISFYQNNIKLTIGAEASFGLEKEDGYDYTGDYCSNGIEYRPNEQTKAKDFVFGISWIEPCSKENDHETWYAADPRMMN